MFGYVRPYKPELKVKEYELFRAAYCGLCWALKEKYGGLARYIINYDLTFLAMLLTESECNPEVCRGRCPASPCRKKQYLKSGDAFEFAADCSVILTYWKLKDAARDGGFKEKLVSIPAAAALKGMYRKAEKAQPEFAESTKRLLEELSELEKAKSPSLDAAADKFAKILEAAGSGADNEADKRIIAQMLYHLGRYIYIIDAIDDYDDDCKSGSYNPLIYRFETGGEKLSAEQREMLETTLHHSEGLISSAYELKNKNVYDPILSNIIYLGLDNISQMVFQGRGAELKYTNTIHKSRS